MSRLRRDSGQRKHDIRKFGTGALMDVCRMGGWDRARGSVLGQAERGSRDKDEERDKHSTEKARSRP